MTIHKYERQNTWYDLGKYIVYGLWAFLAYTVLGAMLGSW